MMGKGMGKGGGGWGGGGPKKNEKEKKVKVTNLPAGADWQKLKDHMKSGGKVEFCNCKDGVGEVRYNSQVEAQAAIATLNGTMFNGSMLQVSAWDQGGVIEN